VCQSQLLGYWDKIGELSRVIKRHQLVEIILWERVDRMAFAKRIEAVLSALIVRKIF
jgi:hypothetical protein